jgi:hypothetical protein
MEIINLNLIENLVMILSRIQKSKLQKKWKGVPQRSTYFSKCVQRGVQWAIPKVALHSLLQ